jgi:hypothetical protein
MIEPKYAISPPFAELLRWLVNTRLAEKAGFAANI